MCSSHSNNNPSTKTHIRFCQEVTKKGTQCKLTCKAGFSTCHVHTPKTAECNICMTDKLSLCKSVTLSCGHSMCETCEKKWKKLGKDTCPFCRKYIYVDSMSKCVSMLKNLLDECAYTQGRLNKIQVTDRLFRVFQTEHGKQLLANYDQFSWAVFKKLEEFDYQMWDTPEYGYLINWRTIFNDAFV